mmetsp:Transcript_22042/g.51869  ORF Transcript_22042/g.51869 Transcript_22042/m.51869 type:complete len:126 (-) Transcript_22042:10-387(-)
MPSKTNIWDMYITLWMACMKEVVESTTFFSLVLVNDGTSHLPPTVVVQELLRISISTLWRGRVDHAFHLQLVGSIAVSESIHLLQSNSNLRKQGILAWWGCLHIYSMESKVEWIRTKTTRFVFHR